MVDIKGAAENVAAVRMEQDGITVYVAAVPTRVIAELGLVSLFDPDLDSDDPAQGYQRAPSRKHAGGIRDYLLDPTRKRLMPAATLLASRDPLAFAPIADDVGTLTLTRPLYIVDGQHRSLGFEMAAGEDAEVGDFRVPVVILEAVDRREEIRQFYTINKTAKGVRSDLADTLLRNLGALDNPQDQWLSIAIDVAERLNGMPKGPWFQRIKQPNGPGGVLSQKSMTESLKQITSSVLRGVRGDTVAGAVNNFWEALRHHMPVTFDEPKNYVIQKSVGVFAWNEVASEYFRRRMIIDRDLSTERIIEHLQDLGPHLDPEFWATRRRGGQAPNYSGRGGMHALATEIIAALPREDVAEGGEIRV